MKCKILIEVEMDNDAFFEEHEKGLELQRIVVKFAERRLPEAGEFKLRDINGITVGKAIVEYIED